jgi:methionyl-tRNA synthetase
VPEKAGEIWTQIGLAGDPGEQRLDALRVWGGVQAGASLGEAKVLFPRIEEESRVPSPKSQVQSQKPDPGLGTLDLGLGTAPETGLIDIAEFQRMHLHVASVLAAERVAGADKLLKLQIDLGDSKRQIVAGIAQHYTPEAIVGKQIVVVANLKPARIRGIDSQGMLLAAHGKDGLKVVTIDGAVEPGSKVS